jgi:hypothetical protein
MSGSDVRRFTCVDGTSRLAVVALHGHHLIGVACADRSAATDHATVSVVVADYVHRQDVGTALLERIILDAGRVGIRAFEADTLLSDHPMLNAFNHVGFPVGAQLTRGMAHLSFPITPNAADTVKGSGQAGDRS